MAATNIQHDEVAEAIEAGQHPLHIPKEAVEWIQSLNPGMFQNFKDIESTWNNPLTQFSVTMVSDPQFRTAVSEMVRQDHAQKIVSYELFLVLFIWILRAWRLSKASTWLIKFWVQLWVGALFWVGSLVVVPLWVWGSPYKIVLGQLIKAVIRHFLS